jgi:putative oxidoreductase
MMMGACSIVEKYVPLIGRILLAVIFVLGGWGKLFSVGATAGYIASKGLPFAGLLAVAAVVIELGGGILLILGWQTRWIGLILFLFVLIITPIFHNFWAFDAVNQAAQYGAQRINFLKNLAIMGGMLYVIAFGGGPLSVSRSRRAVAAAA